MHVTVINRKCLKCLLLFSVLSPHKVGICDTSGDDFATYEHGGVMCQIKTPKITHFVSDYSRTYIIRSKAQEYFDR